MQVMRFLSAFSELPRMTKDDLVGEPFTLSCCNNDSSNKIALLPLLQIKCNINYNLAIKKLER